MTTAKATIPNLVVTVICAMTLLVYPSTTLWAATTTGSNSGKGAAAGAKAGGGAGGGKGGAAKSGASGQGNGGAGAGGPKGASSGAKASRAQRTAMMSKKAAMKQKKQARLAKLQKLGSNPAANERVSKMVAQIRNRKTHKSWLLNSACHRAKVTCIKTWPRSSRPWYRQVRI